ncbi:MAG: efflux RND transporter periplasmic adaptor subunit, partial [Candidatus Saccharicenans sp.]
MSQNKNSRLKVSLILVMGIILTISGCDRNQKATQANSNKTEGPEHLSLTPEAAQLAGIKIADFTEVKIQPELKVPGEVVLNPRKFYRLTTRVAGRVEELLVYEGDRVKKGQVVARLFSLPYLENLTELRLAKERLDRLEKLQAPEKSAAQAILDSAREKLKILGLSEMEINSLTSGSQTKNLYADAFSKALQAAEFRIPP